MGIPPTSVRLMIGREIVAAGRGARGRRAERSVITFVSLDVRTAMRASSLLRRIAVVDHDARRRQHARVAAVREAHRDLRTAAARSAAWSRSRSVTSWSVSTTSSRRGPAGSWSVGVNVRRTRRAAEAADGARDGVRRARAAAWRSKRTISFGFCTKDVGRRRRRRTPPPTARADRWRGCRAARPSSKRVASTAGGPSMTVSDGNWSLVGCAAASRPPQSTKRRAVGRRRRRRGTPWPMGRTTRSSRWSALRDERDRRGASDRRASTAADVRPYAASAGGEASQLPDRWRQAASSASSGTERREAAR